MKKRLAPLVENVTESGTACLLTMVQGNIVALTVSHWLIASRTGVVAGVVATGALFAIASRNRWVIAGTLAVVTAVVDYFSHPAQFGVFATEAVITGLGAGALSILFSRIASGWRRGIGRTPKRCP